MSLPDADIEFLDGYARSHQGESRSAVLRRAIQLLRASELGGAYEGAWQEWADSGDAGAWEQVVADGLRR